ncbi:hypothetical protein [Saccharothrix luteola]|uniref:hypothetical protein n=1 Tax=Saccharothrix luteola TaxID=2893018 RepID=UPI001E4F932F|nr:hypothetical protein [Saccharothrix luteola]MCC8244617.1 hypothetical protein [Saccharothrix luteola]
MSHRLVVPYLPVIVSPCAWQLIVTVAPFATEPTAAYWVPGPDLMVTDAPLSVPTVPVTPLVPHELRLV